MQVLLINGSPHPKGSTATALATVAQQLEKAGIETTTLHVGHSRLYRLRQMCPDRPVRLQGRSGQRMRRTHA